MDLVKLKRSYTKGQLTRAVSFAESVDDSATVEMLEIRLSKLNESWEEFSDLHFKCLEHVEQENILSFEEEFVDYEARFFKANSLITRAIRNRRNVPSVQVASDDSVLERLAYQQSTFLEKLNTTGNTCSSVNLPKIIIPPFSGNYKDWPSFRDIFTGSIDSRSNLSATQKFHYLKSFLVDEAANLIRHIPISDANYIEAWERLEKRYDRVNQIVQSFVQSFLSLPSISMPNVQTLRKITDGTDEVIRGLNAMEKNDRDPWLIYLLLTKLDQDTKHAWAEEVGSRDDHSIHDLIHFLEQRCDALESCQSLTRSITQRAKQTGPIRSHVANVPENLPPCPKCNDNHILSQCSQFIELDIESRRTFVKSNALCFNCLRIGHPSAKCRSSYRCRICKARHHTLVHHTDSTNIPSPSSSFESTRPLNSSYIASSVSHQQHSTGDPSNPVDSSPLLSNHSLEFSIQKQTILPTILAKLQDNQGKFINCRVLLDTGSQSSFITESFAQRLGLPRKHSRMPILGISSTQAGYTRGCISIVLSSRNNSTQLPVDVFVVGKLTSNLPSKSFDASAWDHIKKLELADPLFNVSSSIDLLLGADRVWSILRAEQIRGPQGIPIAHNTAFGWVVTGELFDPSIRSVELSSFHLTFDVDSLLQRFWELEEVPSHKVYGICDEPAEEHFKKTVSRSLDGKYVVALPFKTSFPRFGDTLQSAVSRLKGMERRFRTNPDLHRQYSKFMQEYLNLGHMEPVPHDEVNMTTGSVFYLPHHAVLKPDSSSTKLRVVFDGSAKDSNGQSLNSQLLIGPPIQRDLIGVSLRFCEYRFVFTADIVKMFRQIWVREQDMNFQRIVWRQNPTEQIQHFRLRTVTYGTASAPFLSVRVLKQIADEYQSNYPNAARILLNDVYVDDIMTGANSIETLLNLQSELVALLSLANLHLRKWSSNCCALLARQSPEDCEFSFVDPERSGTLVKVLGMYWNPASDVFSYRMAKSEPHPSPTRRTLLSEIARIFDPLGFLAPSVILFKILFQELWSSELKRGWDDPLPPLLSERWMTYRQQLQCFKAIEVPRNVFSSEEDIELHGFSDASNVAYAAVVYARCKTSAGGFKITIVAAKTKVAPIKPVSIPRLELCGALLLSRLLTLVKSSFNVKGLKIFAWCDSEIVLHWLSSHPRRWTTFVANRTAAILDTIPRYLWHHVPSESNPADCASRGVLPSHLSGHTLWWNGPSWLSLPENRWPKSIHASNLADNESVKREEKQSPRHVLATSFDSHLIQSLIDKTSSWFRLQRIVAYCLRFVSNCRLTSQSRKFHGLKYPEIHAAKVLILKFIQLSAFGEDIQHLTNTKQLPLKSKLLRYSAFLDNDGLLRVGGRIKHATIPFNMKHPIILPKSNNVSSLIIADIHKRYMHAGITETFAFVRQQFWILGSRNLIRNIIHKCKPCFMQRKITSQQIMGDLPSYRIQPSRPFSNVGCDYAGPLNIKSSRCRKPKILKAYIAVFVCMSTKAMHLEVVSDLTTDAFIAALRRFIARRGKCSNIYSDNGTNFQGARRYLTDMHKFVMTQSNNDIIASALAQDGISWHFIPPSAPHFGGLWEAGVKSIKLHLRRVVGSSVLTFEELCTVLTQIEAILNSRPLCSMSDTDLNPLTPAHFLIGEPLTAVPEPNHLDTPPNRLSHWNHLQSMVQGFWKRWHTEYLTTLQERPKWQRISINMKQGDLVVIKEPNLPPTKWLLGRIQTVNPGADQQTRVATIKTKAGIFVRPITKLALLPVS